MNIGDSVAILITLTLRLEEALKGYGYRDMSLESLYHYVLYIDPLGTDLEISSVRTSMHLAQCFNPQIDVTE